MKQVIIKNINPDSADVVLLKAPYEKTVSGTGGTAAGPEAICDMLKNQAETWDYILKKETEKDIDIAEIDLDISKSEPEEMVKIVGDGVEDFLKKGKFPIVLGGEHSISAGAIAAAKKMHRELTIVQIDAHADLRDDNSDYEEDPASVTKYAHSCVMRRAFDLGCHLIQVGIRSMSPMEYDFVKKNDLEKNIFSAPIKKNIAEIIAACQTDKVYLTIDVDGFDPSVFPGTGTSEPGGMSWDWGMEFFAELFSKKEIVAMDVVEVAPRKDGHLTEFSAAKMIYHLIGLKFEKTREAGPKKNEN